MINAADIKPRLIAQVEAFCHYLLPAGKVIGPEFRVGSINGEAGKSLSVALRGSSAGLWQDYASTGDKGDLIELWCRVKGETFKDAFPNICQWLGVTQIERPKPKQKPPAPDTSGMSADGRISKPVLDYLTGRALTKDTLKTYRIRSHKRPSEHNTDFVAFQFDCPAGDPVMLKSTGIKTNADGKKDTWTTAPYYTLWGWWTVQPSDRAIVITEGEYDAMSVHQLNPGFPVLSLPAGSSNLTWIENDFDTLQRFEKIYICTDADDAGEKCAVEMAKRLGQARCFRIKPPSPFKDANQFLTECTDESLDVVAWFAAATSYDPPTLRSCRSFRRELADSLRQRQTKGNTNDFLFPSVPFAYRDGETTIISGLPGHGKSDFLYQSHLSEMKCGRKVCIASFEIPPQRMLEIIIWQLIGHEITSEEDMDRGLDWLDERLFWFCPKEKTTGKELLADFEYAQARWNVSRFVIDSLHFLVEKEDYQGQDEFMRAVCEFDTLKNVHSAVVCHSLGKKGNKEIPAMGDVEGSGGIIKPVDNGITIWRHAAKGEALEENPDDEKAKALHDGMFIVWKQRLTGDWPRRKLWFSKAARVFALSPNDSPPATIETAAQPTETDLPF